MEQQSRKLGDERPHAEKKLGVFYSPSPGASDSGFLVPMDPLSVGPGKPGPEDEWRVPPSGDRPEASAETDESRKARR